MVRGLEGGRGEKVSQKEEGDLLPRLHRFEVLTYLLSYSLTHLLTYLLTYLLTFCPVSTDSKCCISEMVSMPESSFSDIVAAKPFSAAGRRVGLKVSSISHLREVRVHLAHQAHPSD